MRLVLSLFLVIPVAARADEPRKEDLARFEAQLKAAHAAVGPSLATVVVSRSGKYPKPAMPAAEWELGRFDRAAFLKANPKSVALADRLDLSDVQSIPDHGFAGGVIVDESGCVLTANHAIAGATKIYVHLAGGAGSYADIRAADTRSDLAVLKLLDPPPGLKPVKFGHGKLASVLHERSPVVPGSVGLVMGFAHTAGTALDKPKAGLAVISQIRKPEVKGDTTSLFSSIYNYAPLIEYESKFSTGASGAVLLNLDGEVIGLTTTTAALPTGEGRAFALPADGNLLRVIDALRRGEEVEYGFLGVTRPAHPGFRGIMVQEVGTSSPAGLAGLKAGDSITHINGIAVSNFEDLLLHIGHGLAGKPVTLTVKRDGRSIEVVVTLAKFKNDIPFIASVKPESVHGMRVEYGSVLLQMQFNPFWGGPVFKEVPAGVLVRDPVPGSAAEAKLKNLPETARWVVSRVDDRAVRTPAEFHKATAGKKSVTLTLVNANDPNWATREVTLP